MKIPDFIKQEQLRGFLEERGLENSDLETEKLIKAVQGLVSELLIQHRNRARIKKSDAGKSQFSAEKILTPDQIAKLPSWLRDELDHAVVVGDSKQVVQAADGRKYHLGNSLNHMTGAEWTYFLSSVISTRYPTSGPESYAHHIRKIHPSPKPPQLMKQIIEFFTKENELVFDYFMGVGGTLLGASMSGRRAIGIDLNESYISTYVSASQELGLATQKTLVADSVALVADQSQMLQLLDGQEISLVCIDPPYGDMMSRPKTGEASKKGLSTAATPFTDRIEDLGNLTLDMFYSVLTKTVSDSIRFVKDRGHVAVFVKDLQPDGESTNLLHARIIDSLNNIPGLRYLGMKIWADQSINLYPYGYPYAFVSNQLHQYIMFFRCERPHIKRSERGKVSESTKSPLKDEAAKRG